MRFTRDERQAGRKRLTQWQTPAEMRLDAEQQMEKIGDKDLFKPGLVFILEAWAAAVFAAERGASSARLLMADRPDCELMFADGAVEAFEIVEADILGRKRGLEYQKQGASSKVTHWDVEEWATPEQAGEVLQDRALKKAKRAHDLAQRGNAYPPGTRLLIYLNISDYGVNHEAIKNEFAASVQVATPWFSTIWILWKGVAYRVFDNAETIIEP
jgi:hypothetical protein